MCKENTVIPPESAVLTGLYCVGAEKISITSPTVIGSDRYFALCIISEGECVCESEKIKASGCFIVPVQEQKALDVQGQKAACAYVIYFSGTDATRFVRSVGREIFTDSSFASTKLLLQRIFSKQQPAETGFALTGVLCAVCSSAGFGGERKEYIPRKRALAMSAAHIIQTSLQSGINASKTAEILGVSPKNLYKVFKETTGVSLRRYIMDMRMERGRELLVSTNMKIKEVASEVGYTDELGFSKIFAKYYGKYPTEYRRQEKA